MLTEHELVRAALERVALDDAFSTMRYLGFSPKNDTWKSHCKALDSKINEALKRGEFYANNPDYRFG